MVQRKWRIIAGLMVVLLLGTALSGCGGASGILGLTVSNTAALVNRSGGLVTILADISGYNAIKSAITAIALIRKVGSTVTSSVPLTVDSTGKAVGTYTAGSNPDTNPADYSVVVTATDTAGHSAQSDPVAFQVPVTTN